MSRPALRILTATVVALAVSPLAVLPLAAQAAEPMQVEITTPRVALPDSATLSAMTGDFALGDGRTLRVMRPGLHLMVAFDGGWARTVEPVGEHRFASPDGRLEVAVDPGLDSLRVIENRRVTVAVRGADTTLR